MQPFGCTMGDENQDQAIEVEGEHVSFPHRSQSTTVRHRREDLRKGREDMRKGRAQTRRRLTTLKDEEAKLKRASSAPGLADEDIALPKIRMGICAMDKKANSKPMRAIIQRLIAFGEFEVELFGDDNILNKPVSEWPLCDCLLSWHSDGFPLHKAQEYARLRKPYLVNDMQMQDILLDRRKVYQKLEESGIPVPTHIIVDREGLPAGQQDPEGFKEDEDFVELGGIQIKKPFVEKPTDGEDHNVFIYYPHSMGGGVKKLYRKVENKSGDYDPNHPGTVRREGSYIYEEFLTTGGTDVKVYTVGPRYAHAEARKSPVVDGKVTRTADGKEVRFPVLLSPQEKEIARMVCLAFGQKVCGFDLLRSERGKSYVCDVNGWSFVKNSEKYYDDTARVLRSVVLSAIAPHRLTAAPKPMPLAFATPEAAKGVSQGSLLELTGVIAEEGEGMYADSEGDLYESSHSSHEELRCVLAVVRHGDRTPKQKMKMKVTQEPMLELLHKYLDSKGKQAKLKSPNELQELLDATHTILADLDRREHREPARPPRYDMRRVKSGAAAATQEKVPLQAPSEGAAAAASKGDPKKEKESNVELKAEQKQALPPSASQVAPEGEQAPETTAEPAAKLDPDSDEIREKFRIVRTVLEQGGHFAGINRKVQLKPLKWTQPAEGSDEQPRVVEALLILKHGGVLTHAGRQQAEDLGKLFRAVMYPEYGPHGNGLLRLHSTYRHDLKIYSSDEGRVQTSAAAFTQGLLDLEGTSLTPILVSLVKKDAGMLDAFGKGASEDIQLAKSELYSQMTWDKERKASAFQEPPMVTPLPSPPPSPTQAPKPEGHALSSPQRSAGVSTVEAALNEAPSRLGSRTSMFEQIASSGYRSGAEMSHPSSRRATSDGDTRERPKIWPMPSNPLSLLRKLTQHIKVLVEQLRQKCLEEKVDKNGEISKAYSALTQAPQEWAVEEGKPCGGERLLLMFDRWRKLLKAFHNEKKRQFDISKVPDIYDSAKYDAIHNSELGLDIQELYMTAKVLADAVIPNEYGIDDQQKLRIGSKICSALMGKLLADLANMRDESIQTAGSLGLEMENDFDEIDRFAGMTVEEQATKVLASFDGVGSPGGRQASLDGSSPLSRKSGEVLGSEEAPGAEEETDEHDRETLHRLCPTYAKDINSPLRHVRTRIYFTSESHVHSLINVLRFCHLGEDGTAVREPLVSPEAEDLLKHATELDYMTHLVFRMFENKRVPVDSPERFRMEVLFSPGAAYSPYAVVPLHQDHTLPVTQRVCLHQEHELTLAELESACGPRSTPTKASTYTFSLSDVIQ